MVTLIIAGLQVREGRHREIKQLLLMEMGPETRQSGSRAPACSATLGASPLLTLRMGPSLAISGGLLGGDPRLSQVSLRTGLPPTGIDGWEHHAAVGPRAAPARGGQPPYRPGEGSPDHPAPNPESCSEEPGHRLTKSLHFQETEPHTWSHANQLQSSFAFWAERPNPAVLAGVPSGRQMTPVIPWQCQLCSPVNGARCPPAHGPLAGSFLT